MARMLLAHTCETAAAIIRGDHDADLINVIDAAQYRMKVMYRKGARVRLTGTDNVKIDGKEGVVLKVNPKRVTVGLGTPTTDQWGTSYSDGTYNVPPAMLAVVTADVVVAP